VPVRTSLPPALRDAVLAWYDAAGRKFAIRDSTDPYAILVSEVMAQQTQIGRAAEYWERWMLRFPTLAALADASPGDVLREWGGLGYNRRAISLQRAARAIITEHGGTVPDSVEALERLPGIGPYTARAVAAIAFGRPVAAVDTNVRRVISRVTTSEGVLAPRDLQSLADGAVPKERAKAWTHALMDVGATFCRPRRPRCDLCPALAWCRYAAGPEALRTRRDTSRSDAGVPGQPPRTRPFPATTRWLRGRVLDRLRGAPDGAWVEFSAAIGDHGPAAVAEALSAMSGDGLVELDAGGRSRARLPIA
jgi:A/G-specific adenine glycosylase